MNLETKKNSPLFLAQTISDADLLLILFSCLPSSPVSKSLSNQSSFENGQLGKHGSTQVSSNGGGSRSRSCRGGGHHQEHQHHAHQVKQERFLHFECFDSTPH